MQIASLSPGSVYPGHSPAPVKSVQAAAGQDNADNKQSYKQTLSDDQQRQIETLKARDREVRAHEQAHLSAAGGFATSGANFSFVTGPDGQRYAVGGEVSIDTSPVANDPQATILKAETLRRAALAPAQPSGQDQSVASKASAMANKARMELLHQTSQSTSSSRGSTINFNA